MLQSLHTEGGEKNPSFKAKTLNLFRTFPQLCVLYPNRLEHVSYGVVTAQFSVLPAFSHLQKSKKLENCLELVPGIFCMAYSANAEKVLLKEC